MDKLILIGGGGHCKSCIDVIEETGMFEIVGIIDLPENVGSEILGYPIIGTDEQINSLSKKTDLFLITLGQLGMPGRRKKIHEILQNKKYKLATVISPTAYISKHSKIGEGTIIMHHALINANVKIGSNCIINTKALVEHDSIVGNNCHISTASTLNGGTVIGRSCFFGSNSVSKEYIKITDNTVIGAKTFIRKSINEPGVYAGNPLKRIQ